MYDLTDLIFEKYAEGKFSEDKMMILLEADKNDKNEKEELAKKKKAVAKKIAATLLVVAGISAVIVLCKKSGDTDGEEKLLNLREKYNASLKEAKSDLSNAKTVSEVNAVEAKVNNVEKRANNAKRYKVKGGGKVSLPAWKHEYVAGYRKSRISLDTAVDLLDNERDKEAVRRYYGRGTDDKQKISKKYVKQIGRQFGREVREIDNEVDAYNKKLVQKNREWRASKQHGRKLHLGKDKKIYIKSSVDDIISNSYKYLYMIESVVERYDRDIITYESTMDLIDTICVFEAHNDLLLEANYSDAIKNCKVKELKTTEDKKYNKQLEDQYLYGEITAAEIKRVYNKYKRGEELFPAEKRVLLIAKRNKNEKITQGVGAAALAGAAVIGGSMALQNHDNKIAEKYKRMNSKYYKKGLEDGHKHEREHQERLQRTKKKNKIGFR